ncbi:MAG: hypothetical protein EOP09_02070 [Proteobacteria bacterium]|nr:MAG: hypothetical protein EOP09_02070 [Pseudomonadota bacterium]
MAVNGKPQRLLQSESGQALIELLIVVPIFLVVIYTMVRTTESIQVSINNQKYTRSALLRLTFNSPFIYNRTLANGGIYTNQIINQAHHRMTFGLADEALDPTTNQPLATTQQITRNLSGGETTAGEVVKRAEVRIRNTLTLCGPWAASSPGVELTSLTMTEQSKFEICSGPAPVEGG